MIKVKDIVNFIESLIPLEFASSWDNSGIQVGSLESKVKKVGFALSPSLDVIMNSVKQGIDLLITHHPLIFEPIKKLVYERYPSKVIFHCIKHDLSVYSIHTNLDASPLGPTEIISEILELKERVRIEQFVVKGILEKPKTQKEILEKLLSVLSKDAVKFVNYHPEKRVKSVAICSGSGMSLLDKVLDCDLFITGDVKYHDALKAKDLSLTVFDLGHFGTERLFFRKIKSLLEEKFPEVEFLILEETSPFEVQEDVEKRNS
jgi:dinuclear metal center YbgI/SA1388 family protein